MFYARLMPHAHANDIIFNSLRAYSHLPIEKFFLFFKNPVHFVDSLSLIC